MLEHCRAMMDAMGGSMHSGDPTAMSGMMSMHGLMGSGMWFFGLLSIALVGALGLAIGWLLFGRRRGIVDADARQMLDRRYARGELDRDAYLRMRSDLADGASQAG